ncbi:MAG: alpha/beta hydrolase [Cytophagales bacterium]|nr:alpha/beta hydrolase [Cytophagales bacterium]
MKNPATYSCLLLFLTIGCTSPPADFETVTKDEAFRAEVKPRRFVKLSQGYTYYQFENPESDTLLVMVHGFSVPAYIWDSTFNAAATRGFGALRYDTYGRGLSDNPDAVYDVAMAAQQLRELLDVLRINKKVNLLGLSFGGRTISAFAAQYAERVKNLIYVDASGFETIENTSEHPAMVSDEEIKSFKESAAYAGMAKGQMSDFLDSVPFKGWDAKYKTMMRFKGFVRALLSSRKNMTSLENEHRRIAASGIPVIAFWGEHDTVVKLEDIRANMTNRIPNVELFVIPKAGHLPHMEQAAMFNSILFDQVICCH